MQTATVTPSKFPITFSTEAAKSRIDSINTEYKDTRAAYYSAAQSGNQKMMNECLLFINSMKIELAELKQYINNKTTV